MTEPEVLVRARQWASQLPERADEFERDCRLAPDVARGFGEAGFFRMLVPSVYGGLEVHPQTFCDVIREVARGDGSAGWNVMIGSTTGLLSASLAEEHARHIYKDPAVLTVGVTAPMGRAEIVEGGYRVTGRWPFGSGSQNAEWISGGAFIGENGEKKGRLVAAEGVHQDGHGAEAPDGAQRQAQEILSA